MVSPPASFRPFICPRTIFCSFGWMFPSSRYGAVLYFAGSFGSKSANTFSSVVSVSRSFISGVYFPAQKNVFPGTLSRPSRSMPCFSSRSVSAWAKSSPTTATILVLVK